MGHYCIHLENAILEINTDLCTMKRLKPKENQAYLSFNDEDIVIIDQVQKLPENGTYYSDYVFLIICTKGKIEMTYDGRKVTLHEGELFLGVPGSVLSDYMLSPHFDCKIIAVKPSEATVPMELHKQMVNSAIYIKDHPIAKLSEDGLATFFSYYNFLTIRIKKPSHRYYNGEVRALLNAFLLYIIGTMDSEMEEMEVCTTFHSEHLVENFVRMVHADSGQNRFVEYYADRLNITAKYLSTLVRNTLNRTPTEIIKMVTMKEIERRLRYSNQSIKEISNAMNFPNTSFFGKYFKQHSGMTPNSYRKKYHQ